MNRMLRHCFRGLFILTLAAAAAAQSLKFAVFSDTHVGSGTAAADLGLLIDAVNADPAIRFVVLTGDITEKGSDAQLREAKTILGRLQVPFHALPGNHDTHWAGFGGVGFVEAFGADRFSFEQDGFAFLGLNAWDQGHFGPEDILWLEDKVQDLPADADVFFFVHHPPDSIDNWVRVHNILRTRRTVVVAGHVHTDRQAEHQGLPVWTVRAGFGRSGAAPGFAIIDAGPESLDIGSWEAGTPVRPWGALSRRGRVPAPEIALAPPLPAKVDVLWRRELDTRLDAEPVFEGKRLFAADHRGRITCWDLDGRVLWTYTAEAPFLGRPAVQGKFLLAASADGKLIKLDNSTGYAYITARTGLRPTSPIVPFVDKRGKIARFWVGTSMGRLLCVNEFNLTTFWASEAAQGPIQSEPLRVGPNVLFGAWDGGAYGLDLATGRQLWRWTENDNFYYSPAGCSPATNGKIAFFCSPDGFVSGVDPVAGKTVWRVQAGAWESLGLSADGRRVLVKSRLDEFHVLDATTGAELRRIAPAHGAGDLGGDSPMEYKGRILYGARTGRVLSIDAAGRVETILDLGPGAVHTLVDLGGGRFAASNIDGAVVVFRVRN